MDKHHLHWFTDEIHLHTALALGSYSHLEALLRQKKSRQSRAVWFTVLGFLTHAAMVSKLLDPIKSEGTAGIRGEALRAHLAVDGESPVLSRSARDNLEHIDERIDRWASQGSTTILEMVFDDRAGFDFIVKGETAIRRVLIRDEMIFVSEDRNGDRLETPLRPVFAALQALHARCEHKLATESPYNYLLAKALRGFAR